MNTAVPAVVLNLSDHGSLGVARSLGRLGVEVHGVHHHPTPGARSRYFRRLHRAPVDVATADVVPYLLDLGDRFDERPVLVPTGDASSLVVDEHAEALRAAYRFPLRPVGLPRRLYDKRGMHDVCRELGLPTPRTEFPTSRQDVEDYLERADFPVMLKPIDGWRLQARTGYRMALAADAGELLRWYDELEDPAEPNLMLQEYIPGDADSVWMLNGCYDERSDPLFSVTGRKLRQCPPDTGSTSLGVCLANPTVEGLTHELAKATGYTGIIDLGYRFDTRDRRYKLLDVNPRIGATFRLFVGTGDIDVVRALYLDMTGQEVPASRAVPGRTWLAETNDVRSFLTLRAAGRLRAVPWLESLRGVDEAAWWAWDDLRPFLSTAADFARRAVSRAAGGAPAG